MSETSPRLGKSALILLATLIVVPWIALRFDAPLTGPQLGALQLVGLQMLGFALLCFVVSELSGNYSQVDKLWSITPPVYAWTLTVLAGMPERLVLLSVLVSIWGIRLTYNFSRHGAYRWKFWTGHEDYRWAHVRQNPALQGRLRFMLFNLLFISFYQHALLLGLCLPMLLMVGEASPLTLVDGALAAVFLALVVWETLADQQQWDFQREKYRQIRAGQGVAEPYSQGFVSTGLWARSRHPNYFAEQAIWVVLFLFSVPVTGGLNWSVVGCLLLVVLFRSSSELSESISAGKYPGYAAYQQRVPRFLPKLKA